MARISVEFDKIIVTVMLYIVKASLETHNDKIILEVYNPPYPYHAWDGVEDFQLPPTPPPPALIRVKSDSDL